MPVTLNVFISGLYLFDLLFTLYYTGQIQHTSITLLVNNFGLVYFYISIYVYVFKYNTVNYMFA